MKLFYFKAVWIQQSNWILELPAVIYRFLGFETVPQMNLASLDDIGFLELSSTANIITIIKNKFNAASLYPKTIINYFWWDNLSSNHVFESIYSIDLKIVIFPCERAFYFFRIIGLVIFVEPSNSSQKARIHTFSSSKSSV